MQFKHLFFSAICVIIQSCIGSSNKKTLANQQPSPMKVIIIEDFSVSQHKEKRIPIKLLYELADSIAQVGGVLAYGTISSKSFEPLTEVIFDQPPLSPTMKEDKNPFKRTKKQAKLVENQVHQEVMKVRQTANDTKIAAFLNTVEARRKNTAKAYYSDVHNALNRAAQTVCAPNSGFSQEPNTFVVVCSDLIDDWVGGGRRRFTGFDCKLKNPMLVIGAQASGNIELKQGEYLNLPTFQEAKRYVFAH
jgi:hypothetical protein